MCRHGGGQKICCRKLCTSRFVCSILTITYNTENQVNAKKRRRGPWYANYQNYEKGVEETTEFLELFLRNVLYGEQNELKKRYEHIDWKQAQETLQQHEPINAPINSVLCYIRQHGGCKRKDIAEALGMTLISVKRALSEVAGSIEYRGSNKTGGYYAR